uniref:hypothetical protein n=1 Tax=Agathobacter sp. TaxID=2021311 RepID=UPI0040569CBC
MTGIFMVNSVSAVSKANKVRRDFGYNQNLYQKEPKKTNASFAEVLQKEAESVRTESNSCYSVTYGMDRQLHFFDYQTREYYT